MCGIAGLAVRKHSAGLSQRLEAMTRSLEHRGPDQGGSVYSRDGRLGLAARRLRIVDLEGSDQPLTAADGSVSLVFNGEIYNFRELRALLVSQGYRFQTAGDGEVVLALYQRHGLDFVHHIRGMFAVAIWDEQRQELILARDRMGEKPLFYALDSKEMVFGSELRALVAGFESPPELSTPAIAGYLYHNFVPEPLTLCEGVYKLMPGSLGVFSLKDWSMRLIEYWSLGDDAACAPAKDAIGALRAALHESVELAVRADTPVSVALSGGLDSSIVAALAHRYSSQEICAFSVGFEQPDEVNKTQDERHAAQALAEHLGMRWHGIEISSSRISEGYADTVARLNEPVADITSTCYAALAESSREQGYPVMLFGHGGDELFGGYAWLETAYQKCQTWNHSPSTSRSRRTGYGVPKARALAGQEGISFFNLTPDFANATSAIGELLTPHQLDRIEQAQMFAEPTWPSRVSGNAGNNSNLVSQLISTTYLTGNNIVQADRLGMSHSVEARMPLLDYRFVECLYSNRAAHDLPFGKNLLREILAIDLPEFVLERPKAAFRPPVTSWLQGVAKTFGSRLLEGQLVARGVINAEAAIHYAQAKPEPAAIMPMYFKLITLELFVESLFQKQTDRCVSQLG